MPRLACCFFVLLLLGVVGSLRAQAPADPLGALRAEWQQSLEQQDLEGAIRLFTPDAVFLTPDAGRYDDRAAIRTLYKSVIAAYRAHISLTSKREECASKLCVDEGTYSEMLTENATGKHLQLAGSYVLVAKQQPDGAWKIAEMVWTGGPR